MGPKDIVIIAVIVLIIGSAVLYIYKAKKSGKKCIGCPDSGSCEGSCGGCKGFSEGGCCCGCSDNGQEETHN